jgi:hypothetical protein
MGVTIHFEGQLRSLTDYKEVINIARGFAEFNEMEFSFFEEANKLLERVKDDIDWDYQGQTKGIRIQPDDNSDPLILEFDKEGYIQEYCKTQFAEIKIHIKIINLLKQIEPFFENLIVYDEGEYWETGNAEILEEHFENCFKAIEEAKKENIKLSGPFRISDGRIVDLMED